MRDLTAKQKKLLDQFLESRKHTKEDAFLYGTPFKNGDTVIGIEELFKYDAELFDKLEEINDTEILHQNVERYLVDKSWECNR